jgi:hypothetical protein
VWMFVKLQILQYNVVSKWGKEDIEWKYQLRLGGLKLSSDPVSRWTVCPL